MGNKISFRSARSKNQMQTEHENICKIEAEKLTMINNQKTSDALTKVCDLVDYYQSVSILEKLLIEHELNKCCDLYPRQLLKSHCFNNLLLDHQNIQKAKEFRILSENIATELKLMNFKSRTVNDEFLVKILKGKVPKITMVSYYRPSLHYLEICQKEHEKLTKRIEEFKKMSPYELQIWQEKREKRQRQLKITS